MKAWSLPLTVLWAAAIVVAVEGTLLATGNRAVLHGTLFDPDCYMHLQRSLRLMTEGGWHDTIDPRINAPYGFTIHWTAVFDTLLAAGAAPLTAFGLDPHTALLAWGIAISPMLLIATLAVFAWGVRPWLDGKQFVWLTVLLFTQPQLAGAFLAGRPDHHSLVFGLLMMQLAWAYRLFDGRTGPSWAIAAGILAGLQLATSVEALLTILLLSVAIAAVWLAYGHKHLRALTLYLGAATLTVMAWLLWERGQFLITPAYNRVSIAHVVALASGTIAIAAVHWADSRDLMGQPIRKLAALAVAALSAAALTAALFARFFLGPWWHLDPSIQAWHAQVAELQPLMLLTAEGQSAFFAQLSWSVLALPFVLKRLWSGAAADRPMMLLSLIGFAMFFGLTMNQERWAGELQAVMLLPWTLMTIAMMQSQWSLRLANISVPLRSFMVSGALLLPVIAALLTGKGTTFNPTPLTQSGCDWSGAARVLRYSVPDHDIIMMPIWYGPEVLWRSDSRVVAGPYEIAPAVKDTFLFMDGSEHDARAVTVQRGISYVLICSRTAGSGFAGRLAQGKAPAWLVPAPLSGAPDGFRLFRVAP